MTDKQQPHAVARRLLGGLNGGCCVGQDQHVMYMTVSCLRYMCFCSEACRQPQLLTAATLPSACVMYSMSKGDKQRVQVDVPAVRAVVASKYLPQYC
jgi:hypothetical protein